MKRKLPRGFTILFFMFALTVFLYLTRLEAHTRTDIFLPVDYHSIMEMNSTWSDSEAEARALNAYYESYAQQQERPYTIRQEILLSRLSYVKAPPGFRGEKEGVTVGMLCDELERILGDPNLDAERQLGRCRREVLEITEGIAAHDSLRALPIREYIETSSGFAGYVLGGEREITMALRGTDDLIDGLDNALLLPFNLSVQYAPMGHLLEKCADAKRVWLTGHSKGGHNAIYAASIDPRCRATGFNAPGFGIFLSNAQHDGLDRGVNYVINGDVTGFLLFHLERRIVLESTGSAAPSGLPLNNRHRLDNFFSVDELTVSLRVQPLSICVEWITQMVWLLLLFLAVYGIMALPKRLCRCRAMRPEKTCPPQATAKNDS